MSSVCGLSLSSFSHPDVRPNSEPQVRHWQRACLGAETVRKPCGECNSTLKPVATRRIDSVPNRTGLLPETTGEPDYGTFPFPCAVGERLEASTDLTQRSELPA
jgi:hypothetical protein